MEDKIKIIAETKEDFAEIEERLKELPDSVRRQVEFASINGLMDCLECKLRLKIDNGEMVTFFLPNDVQKIMNFGTFMGIYTPKFFFRIEETDFCKIKDTKISYVFTNI
jgi:hypothetical protein